MSSEVIEVTARSDLVADGNTEADDDDDLFAVFADVPGSLPEYDEAALTAEDEVPDGIVAPQESGGSASDMPPLCASPPEKQQHPAPSLSHGDGVVAGRAQLRSLPFNRIAAAAVVMDRSTNPSMSIGSGSQHLYAVPTTFAAAAAGVAKKPSTAGFDLLQSAASASDAATAPTVPKAFAVEPHSKLTVSRPTDVLLTSQLQVILAQYPYCRFDRLAALQAASHRPPASSLSSAAASSSSPTSVSLIGTVVRKSEPKTKGTGEFGVITLWDMSGFCDLSSSSSSSGGGGVVHANTAAILITGAAFSEVYIRLSIGDVVVAAHPEMLPPSKDGNGKGGGGGFSSGLLKVSDYHQLRVLGYARHLGRCGTRLQHGSSGGSGEVCNHLVHTEGVKRCRYHVGSMLRDALGKDASSSSSAASNTNRTTKDRYGVSAAATHSTLASPRTAAAGGAPSSYPSAANLPLGTVFGAVPPSSPMRRFISATGGSTGAAGAPLGHKGVVASAMRTCSGAGSSQFIAVRRGSVVPATAAGGTSSTLTVLSGMAASSSSSAMQGGPRAALGDYAGVARTRGSLPETGFNTAAERSFPSPAALGTTSMGHRALKQIISDTTLAEEEQEKRQAVKDDLLLAAKAAAASAPTLLKCAGRSAAAPTAGKGGKKPATVGAGSTTTTKSVLAPPASSTTAATPAVLRSPAPAASASGVGVKRSRSEDTAASPTPSSAASPRPVVAAAARGGGGGAAVVASAGAGGVAAATKAWEATEVKRLRQELATAPLAFAPLQGRPDPRLPAAAVATAASAAKVASLGATLGISKNSFAAKIAASVASAPSPASALLLLSPASSGAAAPGTSSSGAAGRGLTALGRLADTATSRHDTARLEALEAASLKREAKVLAADAAYQALDSITEEPTKAYHCVTCNKWSFSRQKKCMDAHHTGYLGETMKVYYACKECGTKAPVVGGTGQLMASLFCPRCRANTVFDRATAAPVVPAPFKPMHPI